MVFVIKTDFVLCKAGAELLKYIADNFQFSKGVQK
jgi:hypothetical protein